MSPSPSPGAHSRWFYVKNKIWPPALALWGPQWSDPSCFCLPSASCSAHPSLLLLIPDAPSTLAFVLFFNQAKFCPASQPLFALLPLAGPLFFRIFAWLAPSCWTFRFQIKYHFLCPPNLKSLPVTAVLLPHFHFIIHLSFPDSFFFFSIINQQSHEEHYGY